MANMTVNDRNQFDRVELSVPSTGVGVRNRKLLAAFTVLAFAVLVVLSYAAIELLDSWAQWAVLGGIVVTVIGAMIALSPNARA